MIFTQTNVRDWRDQAQTTLVKAQVACTKAQVSLSNTNNQLITSLPHKLEYLDTIIKSFREQFVSCKKALDYIKVEYESQKFNQFEYEGLVVALKDLDDVLVRLRDTKVSPFILEDDSPASEKSLVDFISIDSIELIKKNISVYKSNHEALDKFMDSKLATFQSLFAASAVKQHDKLQKQHDEEIIPIKLLMSSSDSLPNTILKENGSFENELISILEMLTNHYDQCNQAVERFQESTEKNLNVLYADSLELSDVLKELNTFCDLIFKNESRSSKLIQIKLKNLDLLTTNIEGQSNNLRKYKTSNIPELLVTSSAAEEYLNSNSIPGYLDSINQLTYHYSQFIDIYKEEYLNELYYEKYVYPKKFLNKLTTFLNSELGTLQTDEINRRKTWMAQFGDFIPKQLKLPGNNYPLIIEVITQGLEHIDASESNDEERELLRMLRELAVHQ